MGWGNKCKRGRKSTRDRGKVTWTDNSGARPAPFARAMGRFKKIRNIPVDYEPHLCVGALWTVTVSMNSDTRAGSKFPYLQPCSPNTAIITLKSLMIYSGVVRVEERESNGRIVNVLRHTFVADGGRYIVTNFDYVKPIT